MQHIDELNNRFADSDVVEILKFFLDQYNGRIAFASSYSIEDQVITHLLASIDKNVKIFTLDTGRLPEETYKLIGTTNEHYDIKVKIYFPEFNSVEKMVQAKGVNLFYDSVENRKECCHVRKLEPLKRALSSEEVWIAGLRREQSVTREGVNLVEFDKRHGIIKINPLYNWTEDQVWEFIKLHNIPVSSLYKKGFTSIGCAPCTRAVTAGESVREGRWWWENPDTKECGLHVN